MRGLGGELMLTDEVHSFAGYGDRTVGAPQYCATPDRVVYTNCEGDQNECQDPEEGGGRDDGGG